MDACVDDDTVDLWMPVRKGSGRAAGYHVRDDLRQERTSTDFSLG